MALTWIEKGLALKVARADVAFMGAEALAHAARSARDSKTLEPAARAAVQKQAEDLALRELRTAIAQGFSDTARVRTLPDWETVRARPELEQVLSSTASP